MSTPSLTNMSLLSILHPVLPSFAHQHWKAETQRHITDLYEDLRDGHNLISLLEVLSGETLVSVAGAPLPPTPSDGRSDLLLLCPAMSRFLRPNVPVLGFFPLWHAVTVDV
ncbi:Plectin [Liparis tanakae]|uniref:Plectin n=1 Tax=Liparis tanakae TaxID=230148 RepID=A0A4Z2F3J4_9TELE|nr:Plectin [Liparis tanakae]